jgi:cell division protein FtsB
MANNNNAANELKFITERDCRMRHRPLIWVTSAILVFCTLMLGVATIGLSASNAATTEAINATNAASQATQALAVYKAGQDKEIQYLSKIIEELKLEIKELREAINGLNKRVSEGSH